MRFSIGCFVETSGLGPWEYARVEINNKGQVVLYSGCASIGQGAETALSQIVADELKVTLEDVRVIHGDTSKVPYGMGSNASRTTVMAGSAALIAAGKVKDKLLRVASDSLEIDPSDLALKEGRVVVRGDARQSLDYANIVQLTTPSLAIKKGAEPGISEEDFFASDKRPFPYGVHIAVVKWIVRPAS